MSSFKMNTEHTQQIHTFISIIHLEKNERERAFESVDSGEQMECWLNDVDLCN